MPRNPIGVSVNAAGSTPKILPNAPATLVVTTGSVTATQIGITWAVATVPTGGSPVTGYYLYRDGIHVRSVGVVVSTTMTGLSPSTTYTFNVSAINADGEGPLSPARVQATPSAGGVPGAPTVFHSSANPTSTSMFLAWTAATPDSVSPTQGYNIYNGSTLMQSFGNVTNATVTAGVTPSTTYTLTAKAFNVNGPGAASNSITVVTPAAPSTHKPVMGVHTPGTFTTVESLVGTMKANRTYESGFVPTAFSATSAQVDVSPGRWSLLSFKGSPTTVTGGSLDATFNTFLNSIPAGHKTTLIYYHEPEDDVDAGTFTASQWRAATERLAGLVHAKNRPELTTGICLMSFSFRAGSGRNPDDYWQTSFGTSIDYLGVDMYNRGTTSSTWTTVASLTTDFYSWLQAKRVSYGTKLYIGEYGSPEDTGAPMHKANWLSDVYAWGKTNDISTLLYFDSTNATGDTYPLNSSTNTSNEFAAEVADSKNVTSPPPPPPPPPPPSVPATPVITSTPTTTTGVTVNWTEATDNSTLSSYILTIRLNSSNAIVSTTNPAATALTKAVTGLTTNTAYNLTLVARNAVGSSLAATASFTTGTTTSPPPPPPPQATDVIVYAAGDVAAAGQTSDDATSNIIVAAADKDFVMAMGDLAYSTGSLALYQSNYDPSWGRFKSITHPVPGNHEYEQTPPTAAGYKAYWGNQATPNGTTWYSWNMGSWHFISLDCNNNTSLGTPQLNWLIADLAANANSGRTGICAQWHFPRYSSDTSHGNDTSVSPFWDALYAAGADVILTGHAHTYERFSKMNSAGAVKTDGIRQFVVGTGGKSFYKFGTIVTGSQAHIANSFGVIRMVFSTDSYSWSYKPAAGSTGSDSGTDTLNPK